MPRRYDEAYLILGIAPIAEEVIRLREENLRLRMRESHYNQPVADLLQGTPITIVPEGDGRWGYKIECRDSTTGGAGWDTWDEAARQAFKRVGELYLTGPEDSDE
jgi:hypothetical protein